MDIAHTLIAKSDQLNAHDLLAGSITVQIQKVEVKKTNDQPLTIHISGGRQPFKPCLTIRRVLARIWGKEADAWIGKWLTLYCDESVVWSGDEVGGIRISHMSGLNTKIEVPVRISRYKVVRYIVEPLNIELPFYPDAKIQANKEAWQGSFESGDLTVEALIGKIESQYILTDEQKNIIKSLTGETTNG